MTRKTLEERLAKRNYYWKQNLRSDFHVRAELDRLARQVRRLKVDEYEYGYLSALDDVLDAIREAKK